MKHILIATLALLMACQANHSKPDSDAWKAEILKVENDFMNKVASDGLAKAFSFYAADSAVIMRGNKLVKGKTDIFELYNAPSSNTKVKLVWKPDFVDVSSAGDLAYTYGKYTFLYADSSGHEHTTNGIFHTVWKRQADGNWRFVYD